MAPGRGRNHAEEEPEAEIEQEETGGHVSLQFDEELTWRPGKPIPTSSLLSRLERLWNELKDMDQDEVNTESLNDVADALGQRNLLGHKDRGVKAYTACCIADLLRLCAPDAPFTPDQLKMFYTLVVNSIFTALNDSTHPYHSQHKYVLSSLDTVKSILLINDVDGADELLLRLFSTFFDSVSGSSSSGADEPIEKDVGFAMTDMLAALVDEATGMNPKVIEAIMAQFLRAAPPGGSQSRTGRGEENGNQSTLLLKEEPHAYIMAKEICHICTEKMIHYVSQYFSDVIIDASRFAAAKSNGHKNAEDSDDDDAPRGPTESELKELRKAHLLIRELWRAAPLVLQNVIPQIEAELSADNVDLRQIATETLGDMISGIGTAGPPPIPTLDPAMYPPLRLADEPPPQSFTSVLTTPLSPQSFAQTHSSAYNSFSGRRNDKTPAIRAAWTTAVGYILSTSAGGIGLSREEEADLVKALGAKLNDSDEKVRLAAVKAIELFSFRDFVTKLGPTGDVDKEGSILSSLADRCRDKRTAVRVEAMTLLGSLWAVAAGELASGQEPLVNPLSGIPSRIINAFYANDLDLNVLLDRVISEFLIPLRYPPLKSKGSKNVSSQSQLSVGTTADQDRIRAERILLLVKSLDSTARKAFFAMQSRQPQFAKVLETFLNLCETYNGGVMDDKPTLERTRANLEKAIQYMTQFFPDPAKVKTDLYKFAKANDRRNYHLLKLAIGSGNDYKRVQLSINEVVKRTRDGPSPAINETLIPLIHRSACVVFNRSHLSTIMEYSKSDKDGLGAVSHEILNEISQRNPELFKTHVGELCKNLIGHAPTDTKENDPTAVDILRACSSYAKKYPDEIPQDRNFVQTLMSYALYGRPVKATKYAIKILLAKKDDKKSMVNALNLLQTVMKDWAYGSPHFLNKLATVSQLELQAPKVTLDSDDDILDMTVQKILLQVRMDATDKDPGWVEDADMDEELHAKCISLNILVNRLRSTEDVEEAKERARPVFKLLKTLVTKGGELCKVKDTPSHHKARLRLLAAQLILKLCTHKHFDDQLLPADFNRLAYMTQDPEPAVRRGFVEKLQKYLVQSRLRSRFYTIIFLTAFEPSVEFKQRIETWILSRSRAFQTSDQHVMEAIMGRLISLLAHHPDYSSNLDDLIDHARYIIFYVSNIATEENVALIYKYAERVKQTRDGIDPDGSENLYVLSDLAQAVIRKWQEKKNWSFQAYPGKVGLPIGLYTALPSHEVAQEIAEKQYIPEGVDDKLDDILKAVDRKKKRKSMDERAEAHPPAKKVKAAPKERKEPKPKVAKAVAPKKVSTKTKTPSRPKKAATSSSPAMASAASRRSGRSKRKSVYTERDSSEDDEEMWDGVAEWEFIPSGDKRGGVAKPGASDDEEDAKDGADESDDDDDDAEAREESEQEEVEEQEAVAATADEEEDDEEEEREPTPPPKSNGRKGRAAAAASKAATKTKLPARPAVREKAAVKPAAKPAPKPTARGKRGKAVKDVYDMDMDDDDE